MDEQGWHARRRAEKDDIKYRAERNHNQVEPELEPLNDWQPQSHSAPPRYGVPPHHHVENVATEKTTPTSSIASMSPVDRTKVLPAPPRMSPHLQLMCGPLLRYDTVIDNVWFGALMIVTADQGSQYAPSPNILLEWDPQQPAKPSNPPPVGPVPAAATIEPYNSHSYEQTPSVMDANGQPVNGQNGSGRPNGHSHRPSVHAQRRHLEAKEIYVHQGPGGTFTFWRWMIQIPLERTEMVVNYRVNGGARIEFFVPAIGENMRWAVHSCNGFSAGVNPDDFRGPGFQSGADPVWSDLLTRHLEKPFHAMIGGGDQIYCDVLMREPEMQEWSGLKTAEEKIAYAPSDETKAAIDRFYFNHYCKVFRSGMFARCNRSIPMINMLDDHDLIDGFGSYPDDLQSSEMFSLIGARGYFFYLLFQTFTNDAVDGVSRVPGQHPNKALILGGDGPWIPFPTHSLLAYLGPKVYMVLLDCRAERKKAQVCSSATYDRIWERISRLPDGVEHLVFQLGIPIAYPRMNFLEAALESKFNPLTILGRSGALGLGSFVNKFNKEAELLDDLNDHWTAKHHKAERNWLLEQTQKISLGKHVRITFISGDVHCAAVGVLHTLKKKGMKTDIPPPEDHRYMLNVVTSAIVNTPPPNGVLTMVAYLGKKTHKTMHYADTDEAMVPLFEKDTDGSAPKSPHVMGRRNYTSAWYNETTGELVFEIRVEAEKGMGVTVPYPVAAPPPRWTK